MFDIGFPELLIVSIVALLVLGPERLPEALRTLGLWFGRMRRSFSAVKVEIEREIGMDEVRRQLHNEAILDEMRALESDVGKIGNNLTAGAVVDAGSDTSNSAAARDDQSDNPDAADDGRSHADAGADDNPPEFDYEQDIRRTPQATATDSTDDHEIINEPHPDDRPGN